MMSRIYRLVLMMCAVFLSGCATLAQPTHDRAVENVSVEAAMYDRLPSDYELPPYIRIVSLPLVSSSSPTSNNTAMLGDYWLFSNSGYTLDVARLPTIDAATAYLHHHDLNPDDIRLITLSGASGDHISTLYGQYPTRESAVKARKALSVLNASVVSLRALKAKRCEIVNSQEIKNLCAGAPVKLLTIAEVVE